MRRALALAALLVCAALLLPAVARGHATLVEAEPGTQSRLREAPSLIRLRFTEPVTVVPGAVQVLDLHGAEHAGAASVSAHGLVVTAAVSGLERGSSYTVRWHVTSADGHAPSGVYNFGVRVAPPPPTESVGASATSVKDDIARWALFAALALVVGPLVVRLAILRGDPPAALERRFHLVPTVAAFAVIDVGIVVFLVRASNALRLPLGDLLYGDLQPFAEQTRFGVAFLVMTVGFAVVAALLSLAWALDRPGLRLPALALSLLLASGLSLSGHQATEPNATWASELADWLHLVAACVWVGGLVTLALVVWPAAAPAFRRQAFLGFSRLAIALVAVLVLAGGYLAVVRLPELSDLWETGYGRLLLVKLGIVAFALGWGGIHHLFVRPRIAAGRDPRVRPSLVGETALALVVLLAAAALTNAAPPPPAANQPSAAPPSR